MSYRIGEFARLSGVSVKTLRFYDEVGILRPARIDPRTRYRFYSAQQLQDIALARMLRASGVSVPEVKRLLRKRDRMPEQRALLESLQAELRESLEQTQRSLLWIDSLLLSEARGATPIALKRRAALRVASMRSEVASYSEISRIERELHARLPQRCKGSFKAVLWHRCAGEGTLDGEPLIEVKPGARFGSDLAVSHLPETTVAYAYSATDDDAAEGAYAALREWMNVFGFELAGPKCEIDYADMLEIQFPVRSRHPATRGAHAPSAIRETMHARDRDESSAAR